jgi:hypothetical protein
MKRLLGLLCVLGFAFSMNLEGMCGDKKKTTDEKQLNVVSPTTSTTSATITKPVPAPIQNAIQNTKWYQGLGAKIKSGAFNALSNGYHKLCDGFKLIKGKTANGAEFLVKTKKGRTALVMIIGVVGAAGYAIEISLGGYDPLHVQDAVGYLMSLNPWGNVTETH